MGKPGLTAEEIEADLALINAILSAGQEPSREEHEAELRSLSETFAALREEYADDPLMVRQKQFLPSSLPYMHIVDHAYSIGCTYSFQINSRWPA